ncbi:hypothetical protein BZU18_18820 [Salmonella enterica subsp. enterica serovar Shubra]|nr:hypothetical protein [Salmonella enterica subsp. enterica serovar Shubra]
MKRRLARILCVAAFAAPATVLGYGDKTYQPVRITHMKPVIAWRLGGSSPVKVNHVKDMDFRWKAVLEGCYVSKEDVGKSFVVSARTNLTNDGDDGDKNGTAVVRATLVSNGIEYQIVSGSVKTSGYYNTLNVQPDSIGEFRAICNLRDGGGPAGWWIFNQISYEALPLHQQGSVAQMWVSGRGWIPIESAKPQFSRTHGTAHAEEDGPILNADILRVTLSRAEPKKVIAIIWIYGEPSPNAVLTAYWNDADFQLAMGDSDGNGLVPLMPGVATTMLNFRRVFAVLRAGAKPGLRSENVRLVLTVP